MHLLSTAEYRILEPQLSDAASSAESDFVVLQLIEANNTENRAKYFIFKSPLKNTLAKNSKSTQYLKERLKTFLLPMIIALIISFVEILLKMTMIPHTRR
jgi:hypothetical protein